MSFTQESNVTAPSSSAPNPQPSLSSIVSHFPLGLTRDVRTQTVSLCSFSPHQASTADGSTQISISEFLQLCLTKHPFRGTVPLRLREDLREAQTPNSTDNTMPTTFADAASQLSPGSLGIASSLVLSRRVPSPAPPYCWMQLRRLLHTALLLLMRPLNSRSRSSFSGAPTPNTLCIAQYHHRHMDMSTVPYLPNPVTSPPSTISAAHAASAVDTFTPQFHACGLTVHHCCHQV